MFVEPIINSDGHSIYYLQEATIDQLLLIFLTLLKNKFLNV
jgi:hypothetical protein